MTQWRNQVTQELKDELQEDILVEVDQLQMQIKDLKKEFLQIKRKNKDEYKKPEIVQEQD